MDKTEKIKEVIRLNEELEKHEKYLNECDKVMSRGGWEKSGYRIDLFNPFGDNIRLVDIPGFSKATAMNLYKINLEKHIAHLKLSLNKLIK